MTRALILVAVLLNFLGCSICENACPNLQRLVFQDRAGAPLVPLQVTDGAAVLRCPESGGTNGFVTCEGNTFTYDLVNFAGHQIRAEARTGEVFEGELVPIAQPGTKAEVGSCSCVVDTLMPRSLTLSPL